MVDAGIGRHHQLHGLGMAAFTIHHLMVYSYDVSQ